MHVDLSSQPQTLIVVCSQVTKGKHILFFAFFQEKHTFLRVVLSTSFIAFIAEQQLTYHSTFKRVLLGESNLYSQPYSFL